jgi:hypothetical protein
MQVWILGQGNTLTSDSIHTPDFFHILLLDPKFYNGLHWHILH